MSSEMKNRKHAIILAGIKKIDSFMHEADVFESSRRLVSETSVSFEMSKDNPEEVIKTLIEAAKKADRYVVACFIVGEPRGIYIDKTCQTISTGTHWCLLKDYLAQYGIEYEYKELFTH